MRADELLEECTLPYDHEAVEWAIGRGPGARACHEAGPTGFGLQRHLSAAGIDCEVVAPGLVPQRPGYRVKTDARDARKLARLHAGGLLAPIHVPTPELEAVRDLIRAREDARLGLPAVGGVWPRPARVGLIARRAFGWEPRSMGADERRRAPAGDHDDGRGPRSCPRSSS